MGENAGNISNLLNIMAILFAAKVAISAV